MPFNVVQQHAVMLQLTVDLIFSSQIMKGVTTAPTPKVVGGNQFFNGGFFIRIQNDPHHDGGDL